MLPASPRVLMVRPGPAFSVADVYRGLHKAFVGLGMPVVDLNYDERLSFYGSAGRMVDGQFRTMVGSDVEAVRMAAKGIEAVCYEFWPDVVVVMSGFFVPMDTLDLIRARGAKVVLWHTESPYEEDRQLARAAHADLNIVNDPVNLDRYAAAGARAVYLPHAYDPEIHCPGPIADPDLISDFCFVGTGYPSRVALLEAVDWDGIDVALAGHWGTLADDSPLRGFVGHALDECVDNTDTVELYRATKASANIYRRECAGGGIDGWAMGPREVELAATGTFFLTEMRRENRAVLPMVPVFDGPGELGEQLRWWLAHPDERQAVADAARGAIADRTFVANARSLLAALDET